MKKISISRGDENVASITIHDPQLKVTVHDAVVFEPKPHQFEAGVMYYVDCTPEQRNEIISVAKELGVAIHGDDSTWKGKFPNLSFGLLADTICQTWSTPQTNPKWNWIPFNEFVARLKGEWEEPKPEPDYSNYVGKWFASIDSTCGHTKGKWYKAEDFREGLLCFLDDGGDAYYWSNPHNQFDMSNPRDENPDEPREVRIPFDASRISEALRFETENNQDVIGVNVHEIDGVRLVSGIIAKPQPSSFLWSIDGKYDVPGRPHPLDLFMWVKEVAK